MEVLYVGCLPVEVDIAEQEVRQQGMTGMREQYWQLC